MRQALLASTLALLAGCGSAAERSLIYHPARRLDGTPRDIGLSFEDVRPTAEDGVRLHGWYVPGPRTPALLWCHGNAGNISHRLGKLKRLHDRLGVSVLIFDYRGYGESDGAPSETGTERDARAFLTWLRARHPGPLVYFGGSLGAAVAAALAVREPPAALILETPFTSVRAMANRTLPGAGYLFRTRYDTLAGIATSRAPLLVLHGDRDEVVPFAHGYRVFQAAPGPKEFYRIPGAGHNDTDLVGGEPYWEAWARFLATHVGVR